MKRTAEKVLIVCASILNVLFLAIGSLGIIAFRSFKNDPKMVENFVDEVNKNNTDPSVSPLKVSDINEAINAFGTYANTLGIVFIIALLISIVLAITAFVYLKRKDGAKTAGILLVIAGVLAGVISVASILLYIAAIVCFVRKDKDETLQLNSY